MTVLFNPFTPTEIASAPGMFYGRVRELEAIERSISSGSILIQGPVGIGKSSLLAHSRLLLEGFGSSHRCDSLLVVGNRDVASIDSLAAHFVDQLVDVDERQSTVRFKLGGFFEREAVEVCRSVSQGSYLLALIRLLTRENLAAVLGEKELLLLLIDEVDKCPRIVARLLRSLLTQLQQEGDESIRFILTGITPVYAEILAEDAGIGRFFTQVLHLKPMPEAEALELVEEKLKRVRAESERLGRPLEVEPNLARKLVVLSGGHPHLLQLLGYHLVEQEDVSPDGIIDSKDLSTILRRICWEERGWIYEQKIHNLAVADRLNVYRTLLASSPGLPTRIERSLALKVAGEESVAWLVERDFLLVDSDECYRVADEFLRLRLLDEYDKPLLPDE